MTGTLGFTLTLLAMELYAIYWVGRHEPRIQAWDQESETQHAFVKSMRRSLIVPVDPEKRHDNGGRHRI